MSYDDKIRIAVIGTANVLPTVAFVAAHERSTNIKYFVIADDAPSNVSDKIKIITCDELAEVIGNTDVIFMLTDLTDESTCKTAHLVADCVKNAWLTVAVIQSASNVDELRHVQENFGVVVNLAEQQLNQPVETFAYGVVHGIHSILDEEFYPYLMPVDGADLKDLLTCGSKTFVAFGEASGEKPIVAAVNAALDSSPVKENLQRARSVFVNILGSTESLSMLEANEAINPVFEATNPDGEFYFVVNLDDALAEKIFVMIIVCVSET